ncbi:hypothetical protein BGX38DRAFT_1146185 [Terfezia claveryi]|nr:hypothetical protein BGX38DRAFT_1146185 [Terfezia claveryi]
MHCILVIVITVKWIWRWTKNSLRTCPSRWTAHEDERLTSGELLSRPFPPLLKLFVSSSLFFSPKSPPHGHWSTIPREHPHQHSRPIRPKITPTPGSHPIRVSHTTSLSIHATKLPQRKRKDNPGKLDKRNPPLKTRLPVTGHPTTATTKGSHQSPSSLQAASQVHPDRAAQIMKATVADCGDCESDIESEHNESNSDEDSKVDEPTIPMKRSLIRGIIADYKKLEGVDGCCLPTHPKRLTGFIGSPCETLRAMGVTEIQLHKEFGSETPFSIVTISRHTLVAGKETKNSRAAVTIS